MPPDAVPESVPGRSRVGPGSVRATGVRSGDRRWTPCRLGSLLPMRAPCSRQALLQERPTGAMTRAGGENTGARDAEVWRASGSAPAHAGPHPTLSGRSALTSRERTFWMPCRPRPLLPMRAADKSTPPEQRPEPGARPGSGIGVLGWSVSGRRAAARGSHRRRRDRPVRPVARWFGAERDSDVPRRPPSHLSVEVGTPRAGRRQRSRPSLTASRRKPTTSARTSAPSRSSSPAIAAAAAPAVSSPSHTDANAAVTVLPGRGDDAAPRPGAARSRWGRGHRASCAAPRARRAARQATSSSSSSACSASQTRDSSPTTHRHSPIAGATGPRSSMRSTNGSRPVAGRCRVSTPKPIDSTSREEKSSSHAAYIAIDVRRPGVVTTVARPRLGVLGRVLDLSLHHPRVETGALEPRRHAVGPRRAADFRVPEHLGDAARLEVRTHRPDEVGDDGVTGSAGVAVLEEGHLTRARGDDEGWVADDEGRSAPPRPGRASTRPDFPLDLVERGREAGEREGSLGQVGDDHLVGVTREVEGLDPAPGPQVEGSLDRAGGSSTRDSVVDAPPIPSTWSSRRVHPSRSRRGRRRPTSRRRRRHTDGGRTGRRPRRPRRDEAERHDALDAQARQGRLDVGDVDGVAEANSRTRVARGLVRGRRDPLRRQRLLASRAAGGHRTEQRR